MTSGLLLLIVACGLLWLALFGPPAFLGRLRSWLLRLASADHLRAGLEENDELFRFARKSFEKASQTGRPAAPVDPAASAEIAAVNVYVERTQQQLRRHALACGAGAAVCVAMDAAVALLALGWMTGSAADAVGWPGVVLWVVRSAILAALSFALIRAFTGLARQLLAAANAALEKRHSLGFGRLYVQMKVLGVPDARRATPGLGETELLRAFGAVPPAAPVPPAPPPQRALVLPTRPEAVRMLRPARNGKAPPAPPPD